MHQKEERQFFDGLLLGALLAGIIIALLIIFFVLHNAKEVGEGDVYPLSPSIILAPVSTVVYNEDEIGQTAVIGGDSYTIDASFSKKELDLTYRTLKSVDNLLYASIWSKEGEQLLYKANNDLITVSGGGESIIIKDILTNQTLLLELQEGKQVTYDLHKGMIIS